MGVSKVVYDGETLVDLTSDTVTPQTLVSGMTAHNAAGERITGTADYASVNHDHNDLYYTETEIDTMFGESIIGLSVDGTTVTYIKADGSTHSFETQDTDTTYSLGTDTTSGLTKLYATTGNAEDGTMTQRAIKTELDKKVSVSMDSAQNTLIFTT